MKAKKLLALLLVATMLAAACTACTGNGNGQSEQVEDVQEFEVDGDGSVTYEFNGTGDGIQQAAPDGEAN